MVKSAVLGYPRIGVGRAMKKVRNIHRQVMIRGKEGGLMIDHSGDRVLLGWQLHLATIRGGCQGGSQGTLGDNEDCGCGYHSKVWLGFINHSDRTDRSFFSSGDFTLYDHLLDHSFQFGVIPERYTAQGLSPVDTYFGMSIGWVAELGSSRQPWGVVGRTGPRVSMLWLVRWVNCQYIRHLDLSFSAEILQL